jgi:integrase
MTAIHGGVVSDRLGAIIKVVQTILGHASATMTWDRYGHLYDGHLGSVAERLDVVRTEHLRTTYGQRRPGR